MNPTIQLKALFEKVIRQLQLSSDVEIVFEVPTLSDHGDYSTNVAMVLFSASSKNSEFIQQFPHPRALAQEIVTTLKREIENSQNLIIEDISIAGPGFINLKLSTHYLLTSLKEMVIKPEQMVTPTGQGKKAVVEYSSPNIAKPFTVGHLRSTIIGDSLARILTAVGWQVKRDNHLGDWGTQFGKQMYAIKTWGNEAEIDQADQPVKKLVELYIKFHDEADKNSELENEGRAWFKKLEEGDAEARRLWQKCIDWSWKEFANLYQQLGVTFTENNGRGYGESFFEDKMSEVLRQLEQHPNIEYRVGENGAKLVFFPNDELPPLMIIKKDGATLYSTRDLATDYFRLSQYGKEITVINEVGAEQALYFKQLYRIEELLGWYRAEQRVHVKHGLYRFKDKKMSTRKGNLIWLEEVLSEAQQRAMQLAERPKTGVSIASETTNQSLSSDELLRNASVIGLGALKWNDLKRSSHLDVVFDWDEILNMQGNSGPYLQYTYVRCHSILEKSMQSELEIRSIAKHFDTLLYVLNQSEKDVVTTLLQFDDTVQLAAREYAPHHLATYLYELAQCYNSFYNTQPVLASDVAMTTRQVRLALTLAVMQTLKTGLNMLGIETVNKM